MTYSKITPNPSFFTKQALSEEKLTDSIMVYAYKWRIMALKYGDRK